MLNSKEEIRIEQAVVHIMDPGLGMPVLSGRFPESPYLQDRYQRRCEKLQFFGRLPDFSPGGRVGTGEIPGDFPKDRRPALSYYESEYRYSRSRLAGGRVQRRKAQISGSFENEL